MPDDLPRVRVGRRGFLALAAAACLPRTWAEGPRRLGGGRDLAPGDVVTVVSGGGRGEAVLVHVHDGDVATRTPAEMSDVWLGRRARVVALPADGRLPAGRHEFWLEVDGRRKWLGGYDVDPFVFGS